MVRDLRSSSFVFVSSHPGRAIGRAERRMLKVMKALRDKGATTMLICHPRSPMIDPAREMGATVSPYPLDRFNYIRTRSRVRKYFRRYVPVVAHSTGFDADLLVRHAARDLPIGVVSTLLDKDWPRSGVGAFSRWVRRRRDLDSIRAVDAFIVDGPGIAKRLAAVGVRPEHIVVDPPSVDIARVQREASAPVELDRRGGALVGYAGALEFSRGLGTLVTAGGLLEGRGAEVDLVIGGDGPALRSLQADPGALRVTFTGALESVPAMLRLLDICVFPSVEPGAPTSLIEAAVLGRPIIASAVSGITDLFNEDEVRFVTPGDPVDLADAVAELLADSPGTAEMAKRARARALDEYSAPAMIDRHLEVYQRFLNR